MADESGDLEALREIEAAGEPAQVDELRSLFDTEEFERPKKKLHTKSLADALSTSDGSGVSFTAIVCSCKENDIVMNGMPAKMTALVVTAVNDVQFPYSQSKLEKEEIAEAVKSNVAWKSFLRPLETKKKGESFKLVTFKPVINNGEPLVFGTRINVVGGKYSISFAKSDYKKEMSLEQVPHTEEEAAEDDFAESASVMTYSANTEKTYKVYMRKGTPYLSFNAFQLAVVDTPPLSELQKLVASSKFDKKAAITPQPYEIITGSSIAPFSGSPFLKSNAELKAYSGERPGFWMQIRNFLEYYEDKIPGHWLKGYPPTYTFQTPLIDPTSTAKNPKSQYLGSKEGETSNYCIPCIRQANSSLPGSMFLDEKAALLSMPIFNAHEIFGVTDPIHWARIGPQIWRATDALVYVEIDPEKSRKLTASMEKEGYEITIFGRPHMIVDFENTMKWAGLEVSRKFAFEEAMRRSQEENGVRPPVYEQDEDEKPDPDKPKKVIPYVVSRFSPTNKFSIKLNSEDTRDSIKAASLLEITGNLKSKFVPASAWSFYIVPPYPLRPTGFVDLSIEPGVILREQDFYEKNTGMKLTADEGDAIPWTERVFEANEKYIKEKWDGVSTEIFGVRRST